MNKFLRSAASFFLFFGFDGLRWKYFFISGFLDSVTDLDSRRIVFDVNGALLDFVHEKLSVFLECVFNLVSCFGRDFHEN